MTTPTVSSSRFSTSPVIVLPGVARRELEHLARDRVVQTVDAGHAVAHLERRADLGSICNLPN